MGVKVEFLFCGGTIAKTRRQRQSPFLVMPPVAALPTARMNGAQLGGVLPKRTDAKTERGLSQAAAARDAKGQEFPRPLPPATGCGLRQPALQPLDNPPLTQSPDSPSWECRGPPSAVLLRRTGPAGSLPEDGLNRTRWRDASAPRTWSPYTHNPWQDVPGRICPAGIALRSPLPQHGGDKSGQT